MFGIVLAGWAADPSSVVAVLDFSVPAAQRCQWAWAESGLTNLLQIELKYRERDRDDDCTPRQGLGVATP
jgi:hypothetical protein